MHPEALAWVSGQAHALGWVERVADWGGRDVNGTPRWAFACDTYTVIDIEAGPGVDVVADAATWTASEPLDAIVCCEVLEHTSKGPAIARNAFRNLSDKGALFITAATDPRAPHSAVDGGALYGGEYYRNVSRDDLRRWLKRAGFGSIDIETHTDRGDIYAMARK